MRIVVVRPIVVFGGGCCCMCRRRRRRRRARREDVVPTDVGPGVVTGCHSSGAPRVVERPTITTRMNQNRNNTAFEIIIIVIFIRCIGGAVCVGVGVGVGVYMYVYRYSNGRVSLFVNDGTPSERERERSDGILPATPKETGMTFSSWKKDHHHHSFTFIYIVGHLVSMKNYWESRKWLTPKKWIIVYFLHTQCSERGILRVSGVCISGTRTMMMMMSLANTPV
jgi:hypothetical protein